jgi:hypothetical protein
MWMFTTMAEIKNICTCFRDTLKSYIQHKTGNEWTYNETVRHVCTSIVATEKK